MKNRELKISIERGLFEEGAKILVENCSKQCDN